MKRHIHLDDDAALCWYAKLRWPNSVSRILIAVEDGSEHFQIKLADSGGLVYDEYDIKLPHDCSLERAVWLIEEKIP